MSVEASAATMTLLGIKPNHKWLLMAMADICSPPKYIFYGRLDRLADVTQYNKRSVRRQINELVELGYLEEVPVPREAIENLYGPALANARQRSAYRLAYIPVEDNEDIYRQYKPTATRAKRETLIRQFDMTCQYCKRQGSIKYGPDGTFWTVDRIIPGKHGGEYTDDNITLSCKSCNSSKGANLIEDLPLSLADIEGGQNVPPLGTNCHTGRDKMAPQGGQNVLQKHIQITNTKITNKNSHIVCSNNDDQFEQFWSLYPRKVGKRKAHKEFERAIKRGSIEAITQGLLKQNAAWLAAETPVKFIPHPTTWLHRDGWEDEPAQPEQQQSRLQRSTAILLERGNVQ